MALFRILQRVRGLEFVVRFVSEVRRGGKAERGTFGTMRAGMKGAGV